VALSAGDVPDLPGDWAQTAGGSFGTYALRVFDLTRSVIMWWTPARVELEALRMAGDVEGPSVVSEEAYAFRAIYLQVASIIAQSVYRAGAHLSGVRAVEMLRDLLHEAVTTLERKAEQVEARAMDLRMRYEAQKLRAMLAGLDVSSKLGELIEAAQRGTEAQEHLVKLAGQLREPVLRAERALGSIALVVDWHWDPVLDKDAEAKKIIATLKRMGASTLDATVQAFLGALAQKYMLPP
jgi:hypothetical protein